MLIVPFASVVGSSNLKNLETKQIGEQSLQTDSFSYKKYDVMDILCLLAKYDLEYILENISELIENGENLENTEVLQAKISCLFANEESGLTETTLEDSVDTFGAGVSNELVGSVDSTKKAYGSTSAIKTVEMINAEYQNWETDFPETYDEMLRYIAGDLFSEGSSSGDNERDITWYLPGDGKLVFGTPSPENGSINQPLALLNWSIPINHTEGKNFNWTIECSNGQKNNSNNDNNGTKKLFLDPLNYSTIYYVWVNATESGTDSWTRASYIFTTTDGLKERLGWISKTLELLETQSNLHQALVDSRTPNVTWMDAIETLTGVNVTHWIFVKLNGTLWNYTSIIPLIQRILEIIKPFAIPFILQSLYQILNTRMGKSIKTYLGNYLTNVGKFIKSFFITKKGVTPFKLFRKAMRSLVLFYITVLITLLYLNENPGEVQEWIQEHREAKIRWKEAVKNSINYVASEPWKKSINLNGNVIGLDSNELGGFEVYCNDSTSVFTNSIGYFEGLKYDTTSDENNPNTWGLHRCITTAENDTISATVGNSGNKIRDLINTGAFSDGSLYLKIDFNTTGDDNNLVYVQSQNNEVLTQKQIIKETETQENSQYNLPLIRELITFLVTHRL